MEPYEKKIHRLKIVIHTKSGKVFESMVMELDEDDAGKWAGLLRAGIEELSTLYIPQVHALGWTQHVYFNPTNIEAVELIQVPENI